MLKRILPRFLVALAIASLLEFASSSTHADSSCLSFLASKWANAKGVQPYYIELTMHRENTNFVSYSTGVLHPQSVDHSFSGQANQLFSDRMNGQQPFSISQADQLDIKLSSRGVLNIHYSPWNFDTSWDLSCKGSMLTTYVPNFGIVTLTFRNEAPLIP